MHEPSFRASPAKDSPTKFLLGKIQVAANGCYNTECGSDIYSYIHLECEHADFNITVTVNVTCARFSKPCMEHSQAHISR